MNQPMKSDELAKPLRGIQYNSPEHLAALQRRAELGMQVAILGDCDDMPGGIPGGLGFERSINKEELEDDDSGPATDA